MTKFNGMVLKNIVKHYFKQYLVKTPDSVVKELQEQFKQENTVYFRYGKREDLLQTGYAFLLYKENFRKTTKINSYDLIEFFLNHPEDQYSKVFYEFPPEPLIIYHLAGTTENNRLLSLVTHVLSFRALQGQQTLILSEADIFATISDNVTNIVNLGSTQEKATDIYGD